MSSAAYPPRVSASPAVVAASAILAFTGAAAAVPAGAAAADVGGRAGRTLYPVAERAAAGPASPDGWQAAYDAARDLQEALRRAAPVSRGCAPFGPPSTATPRAGCWRWRALTAPARATAPPDARRRSARGASWPPGGPAATAAAAPPRSRRCR